MGQSVDFLYVGPDKSGSSWLYNFLDAHPLVYLPSAKDLFYFDRYYDRGEDWYHSFFKSAQPGQIVGEISHDYLFSSIAAKRIFEYNQNTKIIAILRHPVDRAFSQFLYLYRGGEVDLDFSSAIKLMPKIVENSQYHRFLPSYLSLFDKQNIGIFLFDDFLCDPVQFGDSILDFLGLDSSGLSLPYTEKVRAAGAPRNKYLSLALKRSATLVRNLGFPNMVGKIKNSKLSEVFYAAYKSGDKPTLDNFTRASLIDMYKADIEYTEDLLGRSLESWRV